MQAMLYRRKSFRRLAERFVAGIVIFNLVLGMFPVAVFGLDLEASPSTGDEESEVLTTSSIEEVVTETEILQSSSVANDIDSSVISTSVEENSATSNDLDLTSSFADSHDVTVENISASPVVDVDSANSVTTPMVDLTASGNTAGSGSEILTASPSTGDEQDEQIVVSTTTAISEDLTSSPVNDTGENLEVSTTSATVASSTALIADSSSFVSLLSLSGLTATTSSVSENEELQTSSTSDNDLLSLVANPSTGDEVETISAGDSATVLNNQLGALSVNPSLDEDAEILDSSTVTDDNDSLSDLTVSPATGDEVLEADLTANPSVDDNVATDDTLLSASSVTGDSLDPNPIVDSSNLFLTTNPSTGDDSEVTETITANPTTGDSLVVSDINVLISSPSMGDETTVDTGLLTVNPVTGDETITVSLSSDPVTGDDLVSVLTVNPSTGEITNDGDDSVVDPITDPITGDDDTTDLVTDPVTGDNTTEIIDTTPVTGDEIVDTGGGTIVLPDYCSNLPGNQLAIPAGYHQNSDGTCTEEVIDSGNNGGTPIAVDMCSDLDGNQATVPAGYDRNANGTCSIHVVVGPDGGTDFCSNLPGVQSEVPSGYTHDVTGNCNPIEVVEVDVCSNLIGSQAVVPSGYHANADGTCSENVIDNGGGELVDLCVNLTGTQSAVPNGYTRASGGICTETVVPGGGTVEIDLCSNVPGSQPVVPAGQDRNTDGTCSVRIAGGPDGGIDFCSNIPGVQNEVPLGYTHDVLGVCSLIPTGGSTSGSTDTNTVASIGGGMRGGNGLAYSLAVLQPVIKQSCSGVTISWSTNIPSIGHLTVGTEYPLDPGTTTPRYGKLWSVDSASATTSHAFFVPGVDGVTYHLKPSVNIPGFPVVTSDEMDVTFVLSPSCPSESKVAEESKSCAYLSEYLKRGSPDNSAGEVVRLQSFLKNNEGLAVELTGVFDEATEQAVRQFQSKYRSEVLDPWKSGIEPTGYVYILTKWKINQIMCGGVEAPLPSVGPINSDAKSDDVGTLLNSKAISQGTSKTNSSGTATTTTQPENGLRNENLAGATVAVKDRTCGSLEGETVLTNTLLLLPRTVCKLFSYTGFWR